MIDHYLLFTDGSVNTKSKIGYGSFLVLNEKDLASSELDIRTKRFQNTSSTKLELETLLWALSTIDIGNAELSVFTDSSMIIGLNDRRGNLEKNSFFSANKSASRVTIAPLSSMVWVSPFSRVSSSTGTAWLGFLAK